MRVASKVETFLLNLGTLGLCVVELFAMYATDGQTVGRTKATLIAPLPRVGGIIRELSIYLSMYLSIYLSI